MSVSIEAVSGQPLLHKINHSEKPSSITYKFATRTTRPAYPTKRGTADTPVRLIYSQIHFVNPLFTSRIKGNWENIPEVAERAPPGWKKQHGMTVQVCDADNPELFPSDTDSIEVSAYKKAWARLLSKVYEFDPFVCPRCGSEMKVLAIIMKPQEIKRILHHIVKQGRPPPGIDSQAK